MRCGGQKAITLKKAVRDCWEIEQMDVAIWLFPSISFLIKEFKIQGTRKVIDALEVLQQWVCLAMQMDGFPYNQQEFMNCTVEDSREWEALELSMLVSKRSS